MGHLGVGKASSILLVIRVGKKQLEIEPENWGKLTEAIARVLRMA
jgi:hypothetical protein